MFQNDDVVSGWLSGQDSIDNPAGPMFIEGSLATEAAMTQADTAGRPFTVGGTTASCRASSCACC